MKNGTQIAQIEERGLRSGKIGKQGKDRLILTLVGAEVFSGKMFGTTCCEDSDVDSGLSMRKRPLRNEVAERRNATCVQPTMQVVPPETQQDFSAWIVLEMAQEKLLHPPFSCIGSLIARVSVRAERFDTQCLHGALP